MCIFQNKLFYFSVWCILLYVICGYVFADTINMAVEAGKNEYSRSCELCHGVTGKGDGPYSSRLIIKPADLTTIARDNNGTVPITSIYRMIDGSDDVAFHGSRRMPIWGNRYHSESIFELGRDSAQTFVRGRIFELLLYLDTLQVP